MKIGKKDLVKQLNKQIHFFPPGGVHGRSDISWNVPV